MEKVGIRRVCVNRLDSQKFWNIKNLFFFVEFFDDLFKHISVPFGILESKRSNNITSEEALMSFVTAGFHLRGNVVKYLNNNEQSEAITEYITSQQAKRPRRAATHASVSHLQLQSCERKHLIQSQRKLKKTSDIFCLFSIVNPAKYMGALDLITYVLRCPLPSHIFRFSFTLPCVCIIKFMFVRLANKYYYYYYYEI